MELHKPRVTGFKVINPKPTVSAVRAALGLSKYPRLIKTTMSDDKTEKHFYQVTTY